MWVACIVFGLLSMFFAEVTCGNEPFAILLPDKLLFMWPVYGLHLLVLGSLVLRRKGGFGPVYIAGCVFGLYEAYMTKMLWAPEWDPRPIMLGGVSVFNTMVLVFFWHSLMSFVVPLYAAEKYFVGGTDLRGRLSPLVRSVFEHPLFIVAFGIGCGAMNGVTPKATSILSPVSVLGSMGVLALGYVAYKKTAKGELPGLASLMPHGKAWVVCLVVLLADYVLMFFGFRLDKMPGLGPQMSIWLLYAVMFGLLFAALRRAAPFELAVAEKPSPIFPDALLFFGAMAISSGICSLVKHLAVVPYVVLFLEGPLFGAFLFAWSAQSILRKRRNPGNSAGQGTATSVETTG
jgi:hypothetical protein